MFICWKSIVSCSYHVFCRIECCLITGPANQSSPAYVSAACRRSGLLYTDVFNSATVVQMDTHGTITQTYNASDPSANFISAVCDEAQHSIWATAFQPYQPRNVTLYRFTEDGQQASTIHYNPPDTENLIIAPIELDHTRSTLLLGYSTYDQDLALLNNYIVSFDTHWRGG